MRTRQPRSTLAPPSPSRTPTPRAGPVAGPATDAAERKADVAAALVTGPLRRTGGCPGGCSDGCSGCPGEAVGVAPAGPSPPAFGPHALPGAGVALDSGPRGEMESRFGHDVSGVRIHSGAEAAAATAGLGAVAFTAGQDIGFAPGRFAPATGPGRRLLAHELAHVVQQGNAGRVTVQAQLATGAPPTGAPPKPAAPHQLDVDVCDVQVAALTNEGLALQLHRVHSYLEPRKRGQDDYYAYANLLRRLTEERRPRMKQGHVWLGADLAAMPRSLYLLQPGRGPELLVTEVDTAPYLGNAAPVVGELVTAGQFQEFLAQKGIPIVDPAEFFFQQRSQGLSGRDPLRLLMPPPPPPPQIIQIGFGYDPLRPLSLFQPFGGLPLGGPTGQETWEGLPSVAVTGGALYQHPFDIAAGPALARQPFSQGANLANPRVRSGALVNWRGALPEIAMARGSLGAVITYQDLNTIHQNFEVFDLRNRLSGSTVSITATVPTPAAPTSAVPTTVQVVPADFSHYDVKLARAFNQSQTGKFQTAVGRLSTALGTPLTAPQVAAGSLLAIPSDHVELYRQYLRVAIPNDPARYLGLLDAVLHTAPIEVSGGPGATATPIRSWNDLQVARATMGATEYSNLVATLAELSTSRVVSFGLSAEALSRLMTAREFHQALTPEQWRAQVSPELVGKYRLGGTLPAAHESGMRGGKAAAAIGGTIDLIRLLANEQLREDPAAYAVLGGKIGIHGLGGYVGSSLESSIVTASNEALLGSTSRFAAAGRFGSRIGGATALGGPLAVGTTWAGMALDELYGSADYTSSDWAALGGRAFVSGAGGAFAGALAAGTYTAVAGSEVPIVGNVIGFGVGFLGYLLVDWAVGKDVEREIRLAMGEGGCPRPVRISTPDYPELRGCFAADTRIRMADGGQRAIASIQPGDKVLAVDDDGSPRDELVLAVRAHGPLPVLEITVEGAARALRCTPEHQLHRDGLWVPASSLRPGDKLTRFAGDGAALEPAEVVRVAAGTVSPVHDITVSGCHTYLAEDVRAHNKYI